MLPTVQIAVLPAGTPDSATDFLTLETGLLEDCDMAAMEGGVVGCGGFMDSPLMPVRAWREIPFHAAVLPVAERVDRATP